MCCSKDSLAGTSRSLALRLCSPWFPEETYNINCPDTFWPYPKVGSLAKFSNVPDIINICVAIMLKLAICHSLQVLDSLSKLSSSFHSEIDPFQFTYTKRAIQSSTKASSLGKFPQSLKAVQLTLKPGHILPPYKSLPCSYFSSSSPFGSTMPIVYISHP